MTNTKVETFSIPKESMRVVDGVQMRIMHVGYISATSDPCELWIGSWSVNLADDTIVRVQIYSKGGDAAKAFEAAGYHVRSQYNSIVSTHCPRLSRVEDLKGEDYDPEQYNLNLDG